MRLMTLFTRGELIVIFFVDDVLTLCKPEHRNQFDQFEAQLTATYDLRAIGYIQWFLGMRNVWENEKNRRSLFHNSYI